MQDSPMEFFNKLSENMLNRINKCMLGKIETFNPTTMKASVIPLVRDKDENKPILIEVPVSFMKAGSFLIRPPYKAGDIVLVVFADEDIDNVLLSGNISDPNSTRKHSLDDAIIVGGIMPFTTTLPSEHRNDLVIAKDDFTAKIVITEDGGILIKSDKGITISGPNRTESW
ncbi:Gp138 family membrane-puncturing spike protein [Sporanaerobacter acetigenes]|uniref:Gp138 family membrane-puncturing spike protein n=1 Tax=Sporanaerobacter acetigenes TaxID=165813 RepID=UPI001045460D|nr:Gp138 family membrane-puncturing spike protein [Sporanaerobacter acetigenes]